MSERETAAKLGGLKNDIHSSYGFWGADDLEDAVGDALGVAGPPGQPGTISSTSDAVRNAHVDVDKALTVVQKLRKAKLPDAWSGEAHVAADCALQALERELERIGDAFYEARNVFADHAQSLGEAQKTDSNGMGPLESARDKLRGHTGWFNYDGDAVKTAHHEAMAGIDDRSKAADQARDAAERAEKLLGDLAGAARLSHLAGSGLDAVSELAIADAGGSGDADELILTPLMADRARQAIDKLSPEDRQKLDALLAGAKSADEQAYILKAMAAGYPMDKVTEFDKLIHDHGDDPQWLHEHLAPLDVSDSSNDPRGQHTDTTTMGREWTQGQYPTCVASSNVMARSQVDPLYALQLTTGGHPGDPAYDNPDAFAQRLRDEQDRVYDDGRSWTQNLPLVGSDGMTSGQSESIANENIAPHTGVEYDNHDLDNADDRRDALRQAEQAVDQGVPVPFASRDDTGGHEMLIVGHDGDMVQIYNPWGYTVWVNEDDFINGHMEAVQQGVPTTPATIRLPK
ncbi:MAG: hypothetical protein HOU81_06905 [Hamadaea sp.]|uniref:hypothetical protein n=1 Tax=Hamadaea sp. TaxID=2024425 RepID=UPI0017ED2BE1|nr:hypothetical protein [Hamadaea sp.]NUR70531.1 hypothetical protein [Hamadaea sp.]NUT18138.1 hypothetical protein [Hamadaea sp.]